jgi:hypothetical protein
MHFQRLAIPLETCFHVALQRAGWSLRRQCSHEAHAAAADVTVFRQADALQIVAAKHWLQGSNPNNAPELYAPSSRLNTQQPDPAGVTNHQPCTAALRCLRDLLLKLTCIGRLQGLSVHGLVGRWVAPHVTSWRASGPVQQATWQCSITTGHGSAGSILSILGEAQCSSALGTSTACSAIEDAALDSCRLTQHGVIMLWLTCSS